MYHVNIFQKALDAEIYIELGKFKTKEEAEEVVSVLGNELAVWIAPEDLDRFSLVILES